MSVENNIFKINSLNTDGHVNSDRGLMVYNNVKITSATQAKQKISNLWSMAII
jgi:hypothetical protein